MNLTKTFVSIDHVFLPLLKHKMPFWSFSQVTADKQQVYPNVGILKW